jgi:hypothetical protein
MARRRNEPRNEADSPRTEAYNLQVKRIFHLCLVSMIPFLGLVLGPIGAWRGWKLLQQARPDPAFTAERATHVVILFGALTAITNWLGVGLMILGLMMGEPGA